MNKIREWLRGKKAYITAVVGVLAAVVAYGDGQIDLTALVAAVWAGAQAIFLRAGIANEVARAQE